MSRNGLIEIFLRTAPDTGDTPSVGYVYLWVENVAAEYILKYKLNNGTTGDVGTSLSPVITHASTTGQTADDHHSQVHDFAGSDHNAATLAQVNAKVSDATLDDSSATRTPSAHTIVSHDTTATGAELTELTDGSTTTLHSHATGSNITFNSISVDTTLDSSYTFIKVDTSSGDVTLTLPLSSSIARSFNVWKVSNDTNKLIITRAGSDTIIGETSFEWKRQYSHYEFVSDSISTWLVK